MILCVLRPSGDPWRGHMTTDDAINIVRAVGPKFVVLTHFGMKMIFRSPAREAGRVKKETDVKTFAAKDGMELLVGKEIAVGKAGSKERVGLNAFL